MPYLSADTDPMNWLDIITGLLIAAGIGIGLLRGFGKTAFDAAGLYGAMAISAALAPALAAHVSFHAGGAGINERYAFGLLFFVFGALALGVSWYAYSMTLWNAGMFDKLLGMCAGVAVGAIIAHTLIATQVLGDSPQEASASLGTVSGEMYDFTTYHSVVNLITGAGTYRRELPNVGGK